MDIEKEYQRVVRDNPAAILAKTACEAEGCGPLETLKAIIVALDKDAAAFRELVHKKQEAECVIVECDNGQKQAMIEAIANSPIMPLASVEEHITRDGFTIRETYRRTNAIAGQTDRTPEDRQRGVRE